MEKTQALPLRALCLLWTGKHILANNMIHFYKERMLLLSKETVPHSGQVPTNLVRPNNDNEMLGIKRGSYQPLFSRQ